MIDGDCRSDRLLQQSVNQKLFERMISKKLGESSQASATPVTKQAEASSVSADELNALRYACGYVPYKLLKKFEKRGEGKYAKYVECLGEMAVDGDTDSDLISYTRMWKSKINRGGLFPLNDSTFLFFLSVEKLVKVLLPQHMAKFGSGESLQKSVITKIAVNEEVKWRWGLLSNCIDCESDSKELLEELIKLWVTIRGFSVTAMWMEMYKEKTKTTTAKKPSLRKGLNTVQNSNTDQLTMCCYNNRK